MLRQQLVASGGSAAHDHMTAVRTSALCIRPPGGRSGTIDARANRWDAEEYQRLRDQRDSLKAEIDVSGKGTVTSVGASAGRLLWFFGSCKATRAGYIQGLQYPRVVYFLRHLPAGLRSHYLRVKAALAIKPCFGLQLTVVCCLFAAVPS